MSALVRTQRHTTTQPQRTLYLRDNRGYLVVERLYRGIGTAIYKARKLGQESQLVAIKRLQASHTSLEAFARELGVVQLLNRQYPDLAITGVLDWFSSERAWYLVMQFVDGQTLESARQKRGGTLPIGVVLSTGLALCSILRVLHAHERPIIHRDIKPANILLRHDGRVVLSDFGAACFADAPTEARFRGTWQYAAPEQRTGKPISPATDMYALGVTLYELLTGHLPLHNVESAACAHTFRGLPLSLQRLLKQMQEQDPRNRPVTVEIVETVLQQGLLELSSKQGAERCLGWR